MAFDAPEFLTEKTFSVGEINQAVGAALQEAFPDPFWVAGELQGYDRDASKAAQRRWGQVYFELVEKEEGSDAAKAAAKALMWGDAARRVAQRLASSGDDLKLADGLKVRFLCAVDFYWPRASLQLKVLDVDPRFTLGDMEKARRELVEKLKREGLYDANRSAPLPPAPRVIGLITSEGSAAFHDFVQELRASGFGFEIRLADARMQGEGTESGVVRALSFLARDRDVEAIALVRGGGSRSDLMWFDREKIALAIAACAKPVLTGIGHEIDLSVADLVAHASYKTPTACARFFIERVRAFDESVAEAAGRLVGGARERLEAASGSLLSLGSALAAGVHRRISVQHERLLAAGRRLCFSAQSRISILRERLEGMSKELALKDPERLLARGYGLVYAGGRLVKNVSALSVGSAMTVRLSGGSLEADVTNVKKDKP